MGKIEKEKRIVTQMIHLYCRKKHHSSPDLCQKCDDLRRYAIERLSRCPFKDDKTACKACKVHCYHMDKQAEIREVMRFSGPRMIFYYPAVYIKHFVRNRSNQYS